MDTLIAISQGLGLAVAAGFFSSAPLAVGASVAALGYADGSLGFADDTSTVVALWALAAVELAADAIWPGAEAGARLVRRVGRRRPRLRAGRGRCGALRRPADRWAGRRCGRDQPAPDPDSRHPRRWGRARHGGDRGRRRGRRGRDRRDTDRGHRPDRGGRARCSPARAAATRRSTRACGCCGRSRGPVRAPHLQSGHSHAETRDSRRHRRPRARRSSTARSPPGARPRSTAPPGARSRTDACMSTFPSLTPVCLSALVTGCTRSERASPA